MPKPTFLRLSDEKKQRFIEAAWKEFAAYHYEKASLSRLVENLGIAKGSIYQYFAHKKDLYFYLIEYANQQKQQFLKEKTQTSSEDFFEWFKEMYQVGLRFDAENPVISQFLYNVSQERYSDDLGNLHHLMLRQSTAYFKKLIQNEQQKGNIRTDIEADLLSFWVSQWSNSLRDFIAIKYPEASPEMLSEKWTALTEDLLEIIKHGMSSIQKSKK
jgi:AcrR family transcriptional regulator